MKATLFAILAGLLLVLAMAERVQAEPKRFCVRCADPEQTYVCEVDTPQPIARGDGLQLYCIVRTSKDGGHSSCAVDNTPISKCAGPVKAYTFVAPEISPEARQAIQRFRGRNDNSSFETEQPADEDRNSATVFGMTRGAVGASKKGIKKSGQAVGGAAGKTTRTVGKAAGKVGSTTKKAGSAVGSAAKTAYDCLFSFFKDCRSARNTP